MRRVGVVCGLALVLAGCNDDSSELVRDAGGTAFGDAAFDLAPPSVVDAAADAPADATLDNAPSTTDTSTDVPVAINATFKINFTPCGLGFDDQLNRVWVYECKGTSILSFFPDGRAADPLVRPGEIADDVDIDIAPQAFAFGGVSVAKGDLLFVNGETGAAEVHVVNKTTAMSSAVNTAFGTSHVVGGAFHRQRATVFLVQDKVPGAVDGNRVAVV